MKQEEISEFYDEYSKRQLKTGANERLISLYLRLREMGMQSDSRILELGCGVGIFTRLLRKTVSKGLIEAVDLSSKSICIAQQLLSEAQNVTFKVADVVHYQPKHSDFDFITLMDVIEHIPLDQHDHLFGNLSDVCNDKTSIAINIPNPAYIKYIRRNNPKSLQLIDQEVHLLPLMKIFEKHSLELVFFEKYSIWEVEDYHFMVVRRKRKFQPTHLADQRTIHEKVVHKISSKINAVLYK